MLGVLCFAAVQGLRAPLHRAGTLIFYHPKNTQSHRATVACSLLFALHTKSAAGHRYHTLNQLETLCRARALPTLRRRVQLYN